MTVFNAQGVMKTMCGEGLELRDFVISKLSPREVIVKVRAAGICGSDVHMYKWSPIFHRLKDYIPIVLGHEFAGEIAACGSDVESVKIGDRVICRHIVPCGKCKYCRGNLAYMCQECRVKGLGLYVNGGFATYAKMSEEHCIHIPDRLSFELAALTQPLQLGANAVHRADIMLEDSVVVIGVGVIGLSCLLPALCYGANKMKTIAVGLLSDTERLSVAKHLGASHTLVSGEGDVVSNVIDITNGGADIVFEAVGSPVVIKQAIDMLRPGGKLVSLGMFNKTTEIDMTVFNRKDLTLIGIHEGPVSWERTLSMVEANKRLLGAMITHRFSLEDYEWAFDVAIKQKGLKVMFLPHGE
jgi:threonine dehydrogenase-like Zn-dependent dehydrogenase